MKLHVRVLGVALAAAALWSSGGIAIGQAAPVGAAAGAAPAAAVGSNAAAAGPADANAQKRRDTIRYGIDSEIMDLISSLDSEKNAAFNDDLESVLEQSRSPRLRAAILGLFGDLEWKGAEKAALDIVDNRDLNDASLVYAALAYLGVIRSKEALRFSAALVKEDNKKLLPALIALMGRAGGSAEEDQLLGWFDSDSFDPNLKEATIKALGEIGSAKSASRLDTFIVDPDSGKAGRIFACQSLAKIKDPTSVASLVKVANADDPNVRAAAVEALGSFTGAEAENAIVQALRDSYVGVRIAACRAAGARAIAAALPYLRYKATSDPEVAVKTEALKALAALGAPAFAFLRERMNDEKESDPVRTQCFGILLRKDAAGSMHELETLLVRLSTAPDRGLYTSFAREVANAADAPGAGNLARILLSDKDFLIRIAGIEWIRKNKATALRPELQRLADSDPSEQIRKRAAEALASF
ncbi:MAG TPA: HEAT repeat domain-containing protein, partial [Rectinemataceae bacterium]|nr:HEAT repeat domain-containing protein [Rectinemataceae bacterium]